MFFLSKLQQITGYAKDTMKFKDLKQIKMFLPIKFQRFGKAFIEEQKKQLQQYREYIRDVQNKIIPQNQFPNQEIEKIVLFNQKSTNPFKLLEMGQRVYAYHPEYKRVHKGIILQKNGNLNTYQIKFENQSLGIHNIQDFYIKQIDNQDRTPSIDTWYHLKVSQEPQLMRGGINLYSVSFLLRILERKERSLNDMKSLIQSLQQKMKKKNDIDPQTLQQLQQTPEYKKTKEQIQMYVKIMQKLNMTLSVVDEQYQQRTLTQKQVEDQEFIEQFVEKNQAVLVTKGMKYKEKEKISHLTILCLRLLNALNQSKFVEMRNLLMQLNSFREDQCQQQFEEIWKRIRKFSYFKIMKRYDKM